MYRSWDPFLPPPGVNLLIPTLWIVPTGHDAQILVNTGEMRLYYFVNHGTQVYTYPIGMGVLDYQTPTGKFTVVQRKVNPDWYIPKELQAKYRMAVMPAGPDNPMGAFKLGLSWGDYGIHGCNLPWAVGRLVSHGCTRLYPEDIKKLFAMVPMAPGWSISMSRPRSASAMAGSSCRCTMTSISRSPPCFCTCWA